jgi:hypothetical protein
MGHEHSCYLAIDDRLSSQIEERCGPIDLWKALNAVREFGGS